jgi:hypothetical protein
MFASRPSVRVAPHALAMCEHWRAAALDQVVAERGQQEERERAVAAWREDARDLLRCPSPGRQLSSIVVTAFQLVDVPLILAALVLSLPRTWGQKTPCEEGAHPSADARVSPEDEGKTRRDWARYVHDYEFSERKAALLREAARMVRGAGTTPFLITYPSYRLRTVNPSVEERFHSRIVKEASRVQAPLIDLEGYVIDEPTLWADAAHLNQWGAKEFSRVLAASIAAAAL